MYDLATESLSSVTDDKTLPVLTGKHKLKLCVLLSIHSVFLISTPKK